MVRRGTLCGLCGSVFLFSGQMRGRGETQRHGGTEKEGRGRRGGRRSGKGEGDGAKGGSLWTLWLCVSIWGEDTVSVKSPRNSQRFGIDLKGRRGKSRPTSDSFAESSSCQDNVSVHHNK